MTQIVPRLAKAVQERPKDRPKMAQDNAKDRQYWPKTAQNRTKTAKTSPRQPVPSGLAGLAGLAGSLLPGLGWLLPGLAGLAGLPGLAGCCLGLAAS